jgi:hypothetical protein
VSTVDFRAGTTSGHVAYETHEKVAADGADNFPGGQTDPAAHVGLAVGDYDQPAPANPRARPIENAPVLAPFSGEEGPFLALLADILDDLERTRIANENRLRQLTRTETDKDGEKRGFGLTVDMPQVAAVADLVEALGKLEHRSTLQLQRALRKHPLGPWVKATIGIGEKQGGRLIAAIGDPYWNTLHDRPRLVSELWAYCGLHVLPAAHSMREAQIGFGGGGKQGDPGHLAGETQQAPAGVAPSRTRGQKASWSATAKMRAYLCAESCVKQRCPACKPLDGKHGDDCTCSPYRVVYDEGRLKYADALHQVDCKRCGPSGKPALTGSPLSAGHQDARAMRLVMKEILKDFWREAKRLHEEGVVR